MVHYSGAASEAYLVAQVLLMINMLRRAHPVDQGIGLPEAACVCPSGVRDVVTADTAA
jgi:hypothetical protein